MNIVDVTCQEPPAGPFADWMRTNSTNIPMLPEVATRVISLAASPDVTISRLAQVISKDQVLTTRLLSLANSAYYGSAIDVSTVPEAIMRVGAVAVRNLAVTLCVTARMQDRNVYGSHGQQLVDHGIGTAYLARLVAEDADVNTESAFLCGLLHDIGKMVILKWHHDHTKRTGGALPPAELTDLLQHFHAMTAGRAFRRWGLPTELDEPVLCHHDYTQATTARRMAAVVYLANRLSHRYGFGCEADGFDPLTDPVTGELGLDAEWLAELDHRAPGLFAVARSALS
ncbi:MAG: HDOD domain-containing protein [Vicinamibacterales bacterium]